MNRTPVNSTAIGSIGYEAETLTLEVELSSGRVYQYFDVPEAVFLDFMNASSHGRYYNQNIKNDYRYVQL